MYVAVAIAAMCFVSCKKETTVETDVNATDTTHVETPVAEETAPDQPMDSVAMQKAWEAYATPGDMHKMLKEEVGTWNCDMTFWMEPNGKPEKYTSTADIKMLLGDKYQQTNYKGDMMGMPFEGIATIGFDNATKEFTSTWIDNMGTGMMVMKGKYDEATKSTTLNGKMVDAMTGKENDCREIFTIVDANTRKMEMYCNSGKGEFKNMEIVMKRK